MTDYEELKARARFFIRHLEAKKGQGQTQALALLVRDMLARIENLEKVRGFRGTRGLPLAPRRQTRRKYQHLLDQFFEMEHGDEVEVPLVQGENILKGQQRVSSLLARYVKKFLPDYKFTVHRTARSSLLVRCRRRGRMGA